MKPSRQKVPLLISLFAAGFMVLVLTTALLSDFSKLENVFLHLETGPLALAFLSAGAAYLTSALSFRTLFGMTPYRVPFPKFFSIIFISDTINFIVSSAGMSSLAARALLLKREKIPYSVTIPLSLAQNMVFNLVLSCVCLSGLVYLHGHPEFMSGSKQTALLVFMAGLLAVVTGMLMILFLDPFRRWVFRLGLQAGYWINRKILGRRSGNQKMAESAGQLETTVAFLHRRWHRLLLVFFWVSLDWCFMAVTLYFCFHTVGMDLPLGLLLVGFTVMFLSSNINPVPAGLGVSESLLAFTFKILGVDFEKTLAAALIFRFVYYLIPLGISTGLFLETMRSFLKSAPEKRSL